MANLEVLALDTAVPQIRAPGAGDGYSVPRDMTFATGTTLNAPTTVVSVDTATDALRITQVGSGNALVVEDSANPDATPTVIDASGNVGIGTASPTRRLHVNSGTTDTGVLIESTDAVSIINMKDSASTGDGISFGVNGDAFIVRSGLSTTRMTIDANGNVGIGTTAPVNVLDLGSGTSGRGIAWGGSAGTANFNNIWGSQGGGRLTLATMLRGSTSVTNGYESSNAGNFAKSALEVDYGVIKFFTDAASAVPIGNAYTPTERMRLDASGNLGIGTTSPDSLVTTNRSTALDATAITNGRGTINLSAVSNPTDSTGQILNAISFSGQGTLRRRAMIANLQSGGSATGGDLAFYNENSSSANDIVVERMRITANGELLVGGTTAIAASSGALTIEQLNANSTLNLYRNDTSVANGNPLGVIGFYGNDTTSNTPTILARITGVASGDHAAGDNPTDIAFGTTPDGTATVAEAGRVTQAGSYVLKGGTTTAAAGVGIIFPATQVASANANSLDDYEEGTWTPTTSTSGYTISSSSAVYTKVGRLVHCRFVVQFSAVGAGNSLVIIAGYPFAAAGTTPGVGTDDTTTGAIYACTINNNFTNGALNSYSGITAGSARTFATNENYIFSITYQV